VELLGPVAGRHPGPERRVRVHPLAGRRAWQQLEEDAEILKARKQLLDPEDGDEDVRERRAHAAVAFGLDDDDRARFRDAAVRSADADLRTQEALEGVGPGRRGQLPWVRADVGV